MPEQAPALRCPEVPTEAQMDGNEEGDEDDVQMTDIRGARAFRP